MQTLYGHQSRGKEKKEKGYVHVMAVDVKLPYSLAWVTTTAGTKGKL